MGCSARLQAKILTTIEVAPGRTQRTIACALPNRARFTMRVPEEIST
jgi:hypothetical protein